MKQLLLIITLLLSGCRSLDRLINGSATEPPKLIKGKVLIIGGGQSNSYGAGQVVNFERHERLHFNEWDAYLPMGPFYQAGLDIVKNHPESEVMLVHCGSGGTSMLLHMPGETIYNNCLERVSKEIPEWGQPKALFFYQGETDARFPELSQWNLMFEDYVKSMRQYFGNNNLPVVYAQIGSYDPRANFPMWEPFKELQAKVNLPYCKMVKTENQPVVGLHLTYEACLVVGNQFYDSLMKLLY